MSCHKVIVLDDDSEEDVQHHEAARRKLHRIARRCKRVADLEEEIRVLRVQNKLMATLCGFKVCPRIVHATVVVQAVARGRMLRHDKRVFDRSVSVCIRNSRMFLTRRRFQTSRRAIVTIQSHVRGRSARVLPLGKAVALVLQHRRDVVQLELLTLRLTSMVCASTQTSCYQKFFG